MPWYPGPSGGRWTKQYFCLQYIINNLPQLLPAPEYPACACVCFLLLESLLDESGVPHPPSGPDNLYHHNKLHGRWQTAGSVQRGGNPPLAPVRVAILALPIGIYKSIRCSSNATLSFQVNLCLVLYACLVKDMLQVWNRHLAPPFWSGWQMSTPLSSRLLNNKQSMSLETPGAAFKWSFCLG